MCACWRLKAWIFNEQCFLRAKAKRTGARNYTCSLPLSPLLHYLCFSIDFITTGGKFTWFMKHIKRGAHGLRPDSWHMNTAHICISVCLQMAPPLIACQPENDLDSPGWMCLHIYWWHCQSENIAFTSEERDAFTVTEVPVLPPIMMKLCRATDPCCPLTAVMMVLMAIDPSSWQTANISC